MPVGNVTGLSSGLEWAETVKLLMQIERRPVDIIQSRKTTFQSQLTNWGAVESKLNSLKSAAEGIDTPNELLVKTATSANTDILTVSAKAGAIPGSHSILINQIATSAILVHETGWADMNTTPVNNSGSAQSFSFQYGDEVLTVEVPHGTTLRGLARLINNNSDNPGVTASIINDGGGGAAPYHLVLTGQNTGEDYSITIIDTIDNPTDLGTGDEFDMAEWEETQTAQNAELRVDGFPNPDWGWPNPWIESASNTIVDIIPDVTLYLKDDSGGQTVNIEVSLDKSAVKSKVSSLISSFNDLVGLLNTLTSYNSETKTAGPLAQDSFAKSLRGELTAFIASNIPGTTENDVYRSLGQVGLSLTSGGKLKLDNTRFDNALDDDAVAVARLFCFDAEVSTSFITVAGNSVDTQGGTFDFTLSYDAQGALDPNGANTIAGENATIHGRSLAAGAKGSPVEGLQLLLANPGNGPNTLSGTVQIYKGLGALLASRIDELTDSMDGRLKFTRDRINDTIDNLNDRIAAWDKRLAAIEENYNRRFQAMETLIGQLRSTGNYLASALA